MADARMDADVIVVGAGLAGLVATAELADAGRRVLLLDQEPEPVARRPGVLVLRRAVPRRLARAAAAAHPGLARARLAGLAGHRGLRPRRGPLAAAWAEAYVDFAAGEKRSWLHAAGRAVLPGRRLGRARRLPGDRARQLGAALPHHLGHRPGRGRAVRPAGPGGVDAAWSRMRYRHRVDALTVDRRASSTACAASARARATSPAACPARATVVGDFESCARRRSSSPRGGIGGDHDLVRRSGRSGWARRRGRWSAASRPTSTGGCWASPRRPAAASSTPTGCGTTPRACTTGTRSGPATASGSCPARRRCGWTRPGKRLPAPLFPGFDTLGTLEHIMRHGHDYTWFVLTAADHRARVRALRLGAEPRPHRARACATCSPG